MFLTLIYFQEEAKNRKAGIVPNSSTAAETPEKKGSCMIEKKTQKNL